jgi:hypothetical protein
LGSYSKNLRLPRSLLQEENPKWNPPTAPLPGLPNRFSGLASAPWTRSLKRAIGGHRKKQKEKVEAFSIIIKINHEALREPHGTTEMDINKTEDDIKKVWT